MRNLIIFALLLSFMLTGCSTNGSETAEANGSTIQKDYELLKPPDLIIQIGDERIRPTLGTYSWSRKNKDGTSQVINADSDAPPKIVENYQPHLVDKETPVSFNFE